MLSNNIIVNVDHPSKFAGHKFQFKLCFLAAPLTLPEIFDLKLTP